MKKLLLVDGNSMIFRAYYATAYGRIMTTSNGIWTNAVYGFNMMIEKAIELIKPDYVLVAFDAGKKTFRHDLYADYKGGRKATPDELKVQFPIVREMLDCMGISHYEKETIEADDIIGSLSKKYADYDINVLTSDKDMLQLSSNNCSIWLMRKGLTEIEEMTPAAIKEKYNLKPLQIIDLKGLMGDPSDNIPGIAGIGEKTAIKLLEDYDTVENLLAHIDELKGKLQEKIINGKDSAILSKTLATINRDVDIGIKLDDLIIKQDNVKLADFYKRYEMNSLLNKISNVDTNNETKEEKKELTYKLINKVPIEFLSQKLAIYCDTDLDNYHYARLYGFGLSNGSDNYYIYFEDAIEDANFVEYLKGNQEKIVYDVKTIYHLFHDNNLQINNVIADIKLMAFLIDNFIDDFNKLSEKYHLLVKDQKEEIYGKANKMKLPEGLNQQINAITVANDLYHLYPVLIADLKSLQMESLYKDIELPLTYVLYDMENEGIRVNMETLNEISSNTLKKIESLTYEIYELAECEFNINSPKQLAEILFDKLGLPANKKRSTAVDVLEKLNGKHPIIEKLIDYRKYQKLYSTYAEGLKKYVQIDGKIHTIYNQTVTQTGRLSSTEPNLQNISVRSEEGREIRKAFVPEQDCVLISCDYSQVELRVLAHMANETKMIEIFKNGIDVHNQTACEIFNCNKESVTSLMRRQAKAVNFGIVYGISSFGLAENIGVSNYEASQFIDKYFTSFPRIKEYMNEIVETCKEKGYVETLLHRRRYIPEINDKNYMIREFGKRAAMNAPIQGTAADLIKIAMVRIFDRLKAEQMKSKIILQIHDEVVLNVYKNEIEQVSTIIKEEMEKAMTLNVPLESDLVIGETWYEAK